MTPAAFFAWALALSGAVAAVAIASLVVVSCVRACTREIRPRALESSPRPQPPGTVDRDQFERWPYPVPPKRTPPLDS